MSTPAAAPAESPPQSTPPVSSSSSPPPASSSSTPPPPSSPPAHQTPPSPSPQSPSPPSPPPPVSAAPPPEAPPSSPPPPPSSSPQAKKSPPPPPPAPSSPPPQSDASPPAAALTSPPPPPHASAASPSTPATPTLSSPSSPSSDTISTGTLAGIAAVAVFAVTVFLVLGLCFCNRKKKKKRGYRHSGEHQGPPGGLHAHYKDSYYDPAAKQQAWHPSHSSRNSDILVNMPPPLPSPPFTTHKHNRSSSHGNPGASLGIGNSNSWLAYDDLAAATNGFSEENLLGEGGFGCVYKGVLPSGQVVAVKQLKSGASQGEKEFQSEVEIISRVHHRHLVSLVGYCIMDNQRLLVYDYVPNNTLEHHLHKKKGGEALDWPTRIRIAVGAARGLAYLHEDCHPRIIHRDIKSANILLDNNFEAQVSDFGLAKLTSDTNTHVTTRVMGTFGYLAPEYASTGKITEKSDVFSFGVVLLELLTGRKPVDNSQPPGQESLVEWARPVLEKIDSEEGLITLADPSLNGVYDPKEMMQMMQAAAACVRRSAPRRPRMGQVVRALEDEMSIADLNKGLRPGHSSVYGSSFSSSEYEKGSYSADIRKFRMALNDSTDGGIPASKA